MGLKEANRTVLLALSDDRNLQHVISRREMLGEEHHSFCS